MSDPRPIGVFDSGVGGLTVLREIVRRLAGESRRSTSATTPGRRTAPRPDEEVLRFSTECARRARRARRQGDRRRLQHLDGGRPRRTSGAATTCRSWASIRPGAVGRGAGDAQPARRRHRDAGDGPLARLLRGDQGREPGGRGLRARDAGASCRWSRPAQLDGPDVEAAVATPLAPLLGERDAARRVRLPAAGIGAGSTRCSSAAPTTRCCGRSSRRSPASGVAIVDSATATASRAGRAARDQRARGAGATGGRAAAPRPAHDRRRRRASARLAARLFGDAFPDVEPVELAAVAS